MSASRECALRPIEWHDRPVVILLILVAVLVVVVLTASLTVARKPWRVHAQRTFSVQAPVATVEERFHRFTSHSAWRLTEAPQGSFKLTRGRTLKTLRAQIDASVSTDESGTSTTVQVSYLAPQLIDWGDGKTSLASVQRAIEQV